MITRYFSLSLIIVFIITGFGCAPSSIISLSNSPSTEVLTSINSVNREVQYDINSDIQDPYSYKNDAGYEFVIPVNSPYKSHIKNYLNTKYLNADTTDSDFKILFELKSFAVDYKNVQNTSDVLTGGGDANVEASIRSNITVFENNKEIGKKLVTTNSNYNERLGGGTHVQDVYKEAANDVLNKHMIMIDNFISSVGD